MVRVFGEAGGVFLPSSADELVWCQPLQGLEPACEVVGGHEVGEVLPELVVAFVVEALDRGVLEGAVPCARPGRWSTGAWAWSCGGRCRDAHR